MPNGATSLRNESILEGFADLWGARVSYQESRWEIHQKNIHFDNAAISANIEHLATELMSEVGNIPQVFVLMAEGLAGNQPAGVEILGGLSQRVGGG
jgi:hypothetical protein